MGGVVSSLFGGGDFDVPTVESNPPDVIDEIFGVERVVETGPDGRQRVTTRRLPLSPEEQALADTYTRLVSDNLAVIEELSSTALAINNPAFQPAVEAARSEQERIREAAFGEVTAQQEEALAKRGLSESTTGAQTRAIREGQFQQQVRSDENQLVNLAEQLRTGAIGRAQNLFGIGTGQQQQNLNNLFQASGLAGQTQLGLLNADLQAQTANANLIMQGEQIKQQREQAVLNAVAAATLGVASGGLGFGATGGGSSALTNQFASGSKLSLGYQNSPVLSDDFLNFGRS